MLKASELLEKLSKAVLVNDLATGRAKVGDVVDDQGVKMKIISVKGKRYNLERL